MTRSLAIARAADYFDSGGFLADLSRRVAFPTESGTTQRRADLLAYLEQEMVPAAGRLGAAARVVDNTDSSGGRGPYRGRIRWATGERPGSG